MGGDNPLGQLSIRGVAHNHQQRHSLLRYRSQFIRLIAYALIVSNSDPTTPSDLL